MLTDAYVGEGGFLKCLHKHFEFIKKETQQLYQKFLMNFVKLKMIMSSEELPVIENLKFFNCPLIAWPDGALNLKAPYNIMKQCVQLLKLLFYTYNF